MQIDRRTILWVVIGVLFFAAIFVVFKTGAEVAAGTAGQAVSAGSSASSAMVGGC